MTTATGIGSLPGTDPLAAASWVLDSLPDLPYLAELPARGVGADAVGRTAGLLVDLPVELLAGSWQVAGRPGADVAAARAHLSDDLAALQVAGAGFAGSLKVAVLGPVTLAATLGQPRGEAALSDLGLRRDLSESLAEGVRTLLGEVAQRLPATHVVLQLDEPALPQVLAGTLPTRSGWATLTALPREAAQTMLAQVLGVAASDRFGPVVHCCAASVPVDLLVASGARAISFDLDLLGDADVDAYGEAVESGVGLVVGAVPTARVVSGALASERVRRLYARLGLSAQVMRDQTVVSPACGLAGLTWQRAREVANAVTEAAARLSEQDTVGTSSPT